MDGRVCYVDGVYGTDLKRVVMQKDAQVRMVQTGDGSWTGGSFIWGRCLWYRPETGSDAEGCSGEDGTDRGRGMDGRVCYMWVVHMVQI